MNERNVAALAAIYSGLLDAIAERALSGEPAPTAQEAGRIVAEFFAGRGALVPASLSEHEIGQVVNLCGCSEGDTDWYGHEHLVTTLERIAKGEEF